MILLSNNCVKAEFWLQSNTIRVYSFRQNPTFSCSWSKIIYLETALEHFTFEALIALEENKYVAAQYQNLCSALLKFLQSILSVKKVWCNLFRRFELFGASAYKIRNVRMR